MGGGPRQELTLGVGADEGGEVCQEGEGREVGKVRDLQRVQQGAETLGTESGAEARRGQGAAERQRDSDAPPPSARTHAFPGDWVLGGDRLGLFQSPVPPHPTAAHTDQRADALVTWSHNLMRVLGHRAQSRRSGNMTGSDPIFALTSPSRRRTDDATPRAFGALQAWLHTTPPRGAV